LTPERWAQIEELFHRAAECDANRRASLLDEACNGDPELRREVEELLSSETSARDRVQAAVCSELHDFGFPSIGEVVSHYRILEGLGGGGMGLVYQAEDVKLGRRVALKFLPEESAKDPAALARFEREARAASALEHPNICPIYEFGEHEGRPFLVMQLLEGQTLRELLGGTKPEGPKSDSAAMPRTPPTLPLAQILDLALQIAGGLEAAHRKGIIHRDIKPANIFVTSQGQAKILDFGLAKLAHSATEETDEPEREGGEGSSREVRGTAPLATPDPLLSRTGVAMGTAGYMSPEQARGEKLDARTDQFSFGLVLYEMATGHRAFEGDTGPELHHAILTQTPAPARQLNPKVPQKLGQIITKAIQKDRTSRYQNISDLRADLETVRKEIQPSKPYWWLAASAVVLVLLAISVLVFKHQAPSKAVPPDIRFRQLTINSSDNPVTSGSISPNGNFLAYVDTQGIHVKTIDSSETETIVQPAELRKDSVYWEIVDLAWLPDSTRFVANAHPAGEAQLAWSSRSTDVWLFSRNNDAPRKLREHAVAWSVSPNGSFVSFGTHAGRFGERESWLMSSAGSHPRMLFDTDENSAVGGLVWTPDSQRQLYVKTDAKGDTFWSRDINGGPATPFAGASEFPKNTRGDITLLPDGQLIFQIAELSAGFTPIADTCDFWTMRVDMYTGKLVEKPKRLTNGAGGCISAANATSDGKRVAFLRSVGDHGTTYVAEVDRGGTRLRNSRHFTLEDADDSVTGWFADSKTLLIGTNRADHYGLFKQSLDSGTSEPIAPDVAGGSLEEQMPSFDQKWIIAVVWPAGSDPKDASTPQSMMRIPITGGNPEQMFRVVRPGPFSCARTKPICVIPEQTADHKQMVVTTFDPIAGRGPELARFDLSRDIDLTVDNILCAISPDGTRLAITRSPEGPIEIHPLRGGPTTTIRVEGSRNFYGLTWAPDENGFFLESRTEDTAELLHVDLQGNTSTLWKRRGTGARAMGTPSPDGKHIAIYDLQRPANMWMMENF